MTSDKKDGSIHTTSRGLRAGLVATVSAIFALSAGLIVTVLLLVALAVAGTAFVWQAIHRLDIDPIALSDAMRDAVIVTIREGSPAQKLETIASLETAGATDAAPFVPALKDATKDQDPRVRQAAKRALDRIAPDAIEENEETRIGKPGEDRPTTSGTGQSRGFLMPPVLALRADSRYRGG